MNVKREKGLDFILEGLKEAFLLLLRLDPETISAIVITVKSSTLSIIPLQVFVF